VAGFERNQVADITRNAWPTSSEYAVWGLIDLLARLFGEQ